ncbi:MAG: bifunctional phosphopantothenoylcysteine decarboxylase/phosphopantothenate--cysteine ligase CoaBC [Oscillospiraceae bacterium]|jgi:phosphopantothenoylcysteine decarboxylase/phosphopantothenate--cysteine ligase
MLSGKNIVLGVSGGIAAYKAADIINRLRALGANVDVIMTKNALEFITPLTLASLSKNRVVTDMFEPPVSWEIEHISLARKADLFLIAPATANVIGKIANGIADDMLTTTVMATKAPVVIAPAMNDYMYENPIVQENISRLQKFGYKFVEPDEGYLACGTTGKGKLAKPEAIVEFVASVLTETDKKTL